MRAAHVWVGDRPRVVVLLGLLLAAGALSTAPEAEEWVGSWKQALDVGTGATVFIGPVAAGAACLAYARLRGSAMDEVLLQSGWSWLRWLQPLITVWALASTALALVVLGSTTLAAVHDVPAAPGLFWIVLPACGVLAAQTAIGAAIGHASGRAWAAPAAVVLVFLLFLWTTVGPMPDFFDTGGARASLAGVTYRVWPTLAVGLGGLSLAGAVLVVAHCRLFLATRGRVVVAAIVLVAWAASWWYVPGDDGDRFARIPDAPLVCAGSQPQVCVSSDTPRPVDDLARKVDRQAAALRRVGVPMPARFVESPFGPPARGEGVVILLEDAVRSTVDDARATDTLVRPAACPADYGPEPPYLMFEVRRLLGRWLQVQAGLREPRPGDGDFAWMTGDRRTQDAWVRRSYALLSACRLDQLRMPRGLG